MVVIKQINENTDNERQKIKLGRQPETKWL